MKSLDTASNNKGLFGAASAARKSARCAQPVCDALSDIYLHFPVFVFSFFLQLLVNFNKNDDLGNGLCVFHRTLRS